MLDSFLNFPNIVKLFLLILSRNHDANLKEHFVNILKMQLSCGFPLFSF